MDIEKTELQTNEESFVLDMTEIQRLIDGIPWADATWSDATREHYRDIHRLLQRIVDLANHAGIYKR